MARRITRFTVGRQRIGRSVRPSEATYTRNIRKQMENIERAVSAAVGGIENLTPQALRYGLQPIYDESQDLVPVDTEALKNSGFIDVQIRANGVTGFVGYAKGGNPHYAVYVHERLDMHHDGNTQAKFLEEAVNRRGDDVVVRVTDYLRDGVGFR